MIKQHRAGMGLIQLAQDLGSRTLLRTGRSTGQTPIVNILVEPDQGGVRDDIAEPLVIDKGIDQLPKRKDRQFIVGRLVEFEQAVTHLAPILRFVESSKTSPDIR